MPTMGQNSHIHIISGALDEWRDGKIILRGVVSPKSLQFLQVDEYQREILPESKIKDLMQVMIDGNSLPDIELGTRGQDFQSMPDGTIVLKDSTYIIDGLQRCTAGRAVHDRGLAVPHIGCVVHFKTTEAWERERFKALNLYRTKLSANKLLHNMRDMSPSVDALHHFSEVERTSPLFGRVSWQQRMQGSQLITAMQLLKTAGYINARFGPGRSVRIEELASALDKTLSNIGRPVFEGNVRRFFNAIDETWSIRRTTFKSGAIFLHSNFMRALAYVFVQHQEFWDDRCLVVPKTMIKKLGAFPIRDPNVIQLAGSAGLAWQMLAQLMIDHLNSGRRIENRLKRFQVSTPDVMEEDDEEDQPEAAVA
jgi:hypothetical protein